LKDGGKVQIPELGSFKAAERAAREVRNPRTGKKMKSPACKVAKFTAAKALKEAINA
ncbi:MAG: HU family DNA-binding protein, partial [Lachnospiraceae bacterium]|nr:HU family DNA-binding protein [Lachnospiraceae bacterium]